MKIGVVALQGGVYEHVYMLKQAFSKLNITGEVVLVRKPHELQELDGVILPGGESTTISALARRTGLMDALREAIASGLPAMGTCAGAILLAKKVLDRVVGEVKQQTLGVMNIAVVRNYFGRQRDSFEIDLLIRGLEDRPFRGVFIRAPAITEYWGSAEPLSEITYNGERVVVAARERHLLALAFHPELTNDTRVHELFIQTAKR